MKGPFIGASKKTRTKIEQAAFSVQFIKAILPIIAFFLKKFETYLKLQNKER